MHPPQPILVAGLFPEILGSLLKLLSALTADEWQKPTACAGWSVKDVALHLLGGEMGNLSRRRDQHAASDASLAGWDELVGFIDDWNQGWVAVTRCISPRLLIDLMEFAGNQMYDYFRSLDPCAMGDPVSWVGPEPAPVWLDLAREYTERWHHQQHIRDAARRPGLATPRYLAPALATFVWGLPRAFRATPAAEGAAVMLTIAGPSGGHWSLLRQDGAWRLTVGAAEQPAAKVILDEDTAWRLFTCGVSPGIARERAILSGDRALGLTMLETVSIIA